MKKTLAILSFITAIGLTACSHENPMQTEPQEKTAEFLLDASTYAEVKIGYKIKDHGVVYPACMLKRYGGMLKNEEYCNKFYGYMLEYSKNSSSPYSDITLKDLTNIEAFHFIENSYYKLYRSKY